MQNYTMTKGINTISGYWNDVIHDRLTFGTVGGGTSIIQPKEYRIFVAEVGTNTQNISTLAAFTQTEASTSLEGEGGTIPNGEWFVISAIGINIHISNVQATTPHEDNTVTSINVTPLFRVSPIPLFDSLMSECTFELYRNANQQLERGGIPEYPCNFGNNGFAGGSGASVPALAGGAQNAYTINPTIYINGAGERERPLTVFHELKQNDQFRGVFKVATQINLASTLLVGWVDFYLIGRAQTEDEHNIWRANFGG